MCLLSLLYTWNMQWSSWTAILKPNTTQTLKHLCSYFAYCWCPHSNGVWLQELSHYQIFMSHVFSTLRAVLSCSLQLFTLTIVFIHLQVIVELFYSVHRNVMVLLGFWRNWAQMQTQPWCGRMKTWFLDLQRHKEQDMAGIRTRHRWGNHAQVRHMR